MKGICSMISYFLLKDKPKSLKLYTSKMIMVLLQKLLKFKLWLKVMSMESIFIQAKPHQQSESLVQIEVSSSELILKMMFIQFKTLYIKESEITL